METKTPDLDEEVVQIVDESTGVEGLDSAEIAPVSSSLVRLLFDQGDFHETIEHESQNTDLLTSIGYVDLLLKDLGIKDSPFFADEKVKADFRLRLKTFIEYLDKSICEVERLIRGSEDCSNFSSNWRKNFRTASYLAFFIHYGAKRSGDMDEHGEPRDYVYHVVEVAFQEIIKKARFFCGPTVIAAILHDALEDWDSGLLCEAGDGREFDNNDFEIYKKWLIRICENFGSESGKKYQTTENVSSFFSNIVPICDLIEGMTKFPNHSNKSRAMLDLVVKICRYEGSRSFSASRLLLIKFADLLDNLRTFKTLAAGKPLSEQYTRGMEFKAIFLKSAAIAIGALVASDSLDDLLLLNDPEERERRTVLRRNASAVDREQGGEIEDLRLAFRTEFQDELRIAADNPNLNEGVDYVLEYMPIGFRHEDPREHEKWAKAGYSRAMQNFVVFRPVGGGRDKDLIWVQAADVFCKLFPDDLLEKHVDRGELDNVLGRKFLENRLGVPPHKHGFSTKYGIGVWSAFRSASDLSGKVLSDINRGYFYRDEEAVDARAKVIDLFTRIKPFALHLDKQYQILDQLRDDPALILGATRSAVDCSMCNRPFEESDLALLEEVLDKLVMTLFMDKPREVNVRVNGEDFVVQIPETRDDYTPLVFAAPWLLGRSVGLARRSSDRNRVEYLIDITDPIDPDFLRTQVSGSFSMIDDYEDKLLSDKVSVIKLVSSMSAVARKRKNRRGKK